MTTHGRFSDFTICIATEVFPEPEEPATPMIVTSSHGGEYRTSVVEDMRGGLDSIVASCQNRERWTRKIPSDEAFLGVDFEYAYLSRCGLSPVTK